MATSISGKEWAVGMLFSSREFVFQIPPYQRPYAWGESEAGALFDDVEAALGSAGGKLDPAPPYFFGSIVVIKDDGAAVAEVVDGQQRLTTLTLLLAALRSELEGPARSSLQPLIYEPEDTIFRTPARYRLTLRKLDEAFFRERVQMDSGLATLDALNLDKLSDSQKNLARNAKLMVARVRALPSERRVQLAQYLATRCFLVVVWTANFDSAYRIFSVLNDRGLDLSHADVLKADVLGALSNETERDAYAAKWEGIEEELGREPFKELFSHIRTIFVRKKVDKTVLAELREHVKPATKPKWFVDDVLVPYAGALETIRAANYESTADAAKVNGLLRWLERVDNRDWEPTAIVLVSRYEASVANLTQALAALERLAGVLMVARADINERINRYAAILELLEKKDTPIDSLCAAIAPTEAERTQAFTIVDGELYENPKVRGYVLLRIDGLLSGAAAPHARDNPTVEHVLPQAPQAGSVWLKWWPDDAIRIRWTHRLGNLLLLTQRKNSQASRLDFEDKKKKYFQTKGGVSDFPLTTQVLKEKTWDLPVVERRQRELLEVLKGHWAE